MTSSYGGGPLIINSQQFQAMKKSLEEDWLTESGCEDVLKFHTWLHL